MAEVGGFTPASAQLLGAEEHIESALPAPLWEATAPQGEAEITALHCKNC